MHNNAFRCASTEQRRRRRAPSAHEAALRPAVPPTFRRNCEPSVVKPASATLCGALRPSCGPVGGWHRNAAMGYDTDLFVDGDRISRQLICSICSGVLENPVMTPCEHLFWYVRLGDSCLRTPPRAAAARAVRRAGRSTIPPSDPHRNSHRACRGAQRGGAARVAGEQEHVPP